jgi:hypothetical protein
LKNKNDDKKKRNNSAVNAGLAAAASEVVDRYGSAAAEFIKGYKGEIGPNGKVVKGLKDIAKSTSHSYANTKQQAGFAGEILFENRTNAENIINKSSERIRRTDALGETNHQQFDHVRTDVNGKPILDANGNYTGTSQMKLRGHYDLDEYIKTKQQKDPNWKPPKDLTQEKLIKLSSKENAKKLLNSDFSKYKNGESLDIPTEQYDYAKEYLHNQKIKLQKQIKVLEEKGDLENLQAAKDKLERVNSVDKRLRKSISSKDAMAARGNAFRQTAKEVHSVSHRAGMEQAKSGAIIGGAISLSRNIVAYVRGEEKDIKKLAVNVGKDTGGAAALSYATGYSGAAIKALMERSGKEVFRNLSKTNMPAMIATAAFEVGKSFKRYLTEDDFDELQLIEELGEKGTGMMAASMGAAVGTAIFPGVGTVVGGMVGYMTSTTIYQSAMDLLKEGRLSEEKRIMVEQLAEEAIQSIQLQRAELSELIETHLAQRKEVFDRCLTAINNSIFTGNHDRFLDNVNELAITFGIELQFTNFEEFDEFMSDDATVFKF